MEMICKKSKEDCDFRGWGISSVSLYNPLGERELQPAGSSIPVPLRPILSVEMGLSHYLNLMCGLVIQVI